MEDKNKNISVACPGGLNWKRPFEMESKDRNDAVGASIYNNKPGFVVPDESTGVKPFALTPENEEDVMFQLYRRIGHVINRYKEQHGIESLIDLVALVDVLAGGNPE